MIVWGGSNGSPLNDGARYNPAANSWTAVSAAVAPATRHSHTAVWTGSEMIVWGGSNGNPLNDGGRYHPATNIWSGVSATGVPVARQNHSAAWTGSAMLVWGGHNGISAFNDTFSYTPTRILYLYQRP
jgi:N-acetylneuraminic acid mutarotase